MKKPAELFVYGAEVLCPSCVNLPSSKETYEWLEAALKRKYPGQPFSITYIDIHRPPKNDPEKQEISKKILNDEYFYPLVLVGDQVVGEGNPKLKDVCKEMEKQGYEPAKI
ncbi:MULTISPECIES: YuzD family protein [Bacillus]|uniref:YuzD family protein n=1 Tax=Bacillus TaxID=1386 RepID=UPI0003FC8559|nr:MULTISPECIES: YuzD family protein [Bacillus]QHZ45731.1 YuzD family protein [Bacillus sp. NSP9.1]WFA04463.1 YuzD family protein [Bacillus sp. HSf4]